MTKKYKFPKSARLLKKSDFEAVFRKGAFFENSLFRLRVLYNSQNRLGLAVSSKVGGSVKRNRLKRVIREWFRLNQLDFKLGDALVVGKPLAAKKDNREIRASIASLFKKALKK